MARLPRLYVPGCSYHVVQRGNNRDPCFYDEADYKAYLAFLKDSAENNDVAIHAFVLMTNHVYLLVTPKRDGDMSRLMQRSALLHVGACPARDKIPHSINIKAPDEYHQGLFIGVLYQGVFSYLLKQSKQN